MSEEPRSRAERRRDTEQRLAQDVDLWVASASKDGAPYLVPLSFDWDGEAILARHAGEQPDRPESGRHAHRADWAGARPATSR